MKERPILMSAPMVRAILEGRKTQTRRVLKNRHGNEWTRDEWGNLWPACPVNIDDDIVTGMLPCPYGQPGDRLWVKETFRNQAGNMEYVALRYRADDSIIKYEDHSLKDVSNKWKWRPSIFMPRWASRITLEIVGVRVERLQDISHKDALSEGVRYDVSKSDGSPLDCYKALWESINGKGSWDVNPWVWVIEFKRL